MYNPDNWAVVKVEESEFGDSFYKIVAGWNGGYVGGDSWKLNSGVTEVTQDERYYYFHGASGSVYQCHKIAEGISSSMNPILSSINGHDRTSIVKFDMNAMNNNLLKK